MKIALVVAAARNGVIGRAGGLPWHLPDDLRRFRKRTTGHTILMGRRTFESIGQALPDRTTYVLTRNLHLSAPGCTLVSTFDEARTRAEKAGETDLFVVGGAEIYALAMTSAAEIHLTRIDADIEGDVHFPTLDPTQWSEAAREHHDADDRHPFPFDFLTLKRPETQIEAC